MAKDVEYFLTHICCVEWLRFFFKETPLTSLLVTGWCFCFRCYVCRWICRLCWGVRTLAFLRWGVTVWVCDSASFSVLRVHTLCCALFFNITVWFLSQVAYLEWMRKEGELDRGGATQVICWDKRHECSKVVSLEFFLFKFLLIAETFLVCESLTLSFFK
jgi:hypothetical protein